MSSVQRLCDIFSDIVGKKITLVDGDMSETDGRVIYADLENKDVYNEVEHCVSHILFGSNPILLDEYAKLYSKAAAKQLGCESRVVYEFVYSLVNLLEDHRVMALWARQYPGSAELYHERQMRLWSKQKASVWKDCAFAESNPFLRAVELIKDAGQESVLVSTNQLIIEIVGAKAIQLDCSRKEAFLSLLKSYSPYHPGLILPKYSSSQERHAAQRVAVDVLKTQKVDKQAQIPRPKPNKDKKIKRGVKGRTIIKTNTSGKSQLSRTEKEISKRLRTTFMIERRRRNSILESEGTSVDVQAVIDNMVSSKQDPCFESSSNTRGFRAVLLLDRSKSMTGQRTEQLDSVVRILRDALDFPFIQMDIVNFNSTDSDTLNLTLGEFTEAPAGRTPLHLAIRAVNNMVNGDARQTHLFIVTDGYPQHKEDEDWLPVDEILDLTRNEINKIRNKGVKVHSLLLAEESDGVVSYEIDDDDAKYIFSTYEKLELQFDRELANKIARRFV